MSLEDAVARLQLEIARHGLPVPKSRPKRYAVLEICNVPLNIRPHCEDAEVTIHEWGEWEVNVPQGESRTASWYEYGLTASLAKPDGTRVVLVGVSDQVETGAGYPVIAKAMSMAINRAAALGWYTDAVDIGWLSPRDDGTDATLQTTYPIFYSHHEHDLDPEGEDG